MKLNGMLTAAVLAMVATALAQDGQPATGKPNLNEPPSAEQVAMARLMVEAGLATLPAQMARQFNLNEEQREAASKIVRDHWDQFGKENQESLLRVMVHGRQLMESGQAEPADWQQLAKQAQPILDASMKMFNDSASEFEQILDEDQQARLAERMIEFQSGQEMLLARTRLVAEGEVKLGANGQPEGGEQAWPAEAQMFNRGRNDVRVVEERIEEIGPDGVARQIVVKRINSRLPDEASVAADERLWPGYVRGFIAKYDLDAEQQKLARRVLGDSLKRANEVRTRAKPQLEAARKRLAEAEKGGDPAAVAAAKLASEQLNRPIVAIFNELKRQLENMLSSEQLEAGKTRGELFGAKREAPPAPAASEPAPGDPAGTKTPPEDVKVHVLD